MAEPKWKQQAIPVGEAQQAEPSWKMQAIPVEDVPFQVASPETPDPTRPPPPDRPDGTRSRGNELSFFQWYVGPEFQIQDITDEGALVFANPKTGERAYWSDKGEIFDQGAIESILSGVPEAKVRQQQNRRMIGEMLMKTEPLMTRVRQTASGALGVGEYLDELAGAVRGPEAQEAFRAQTEAFERERPLEAGAYKILGGVTSVPGGGAGITIPGRGVAQKVVTGGAMGLGAGAVEGGIAGYGAGETPEERAALAGEGSAIGALFGGALGAAMDPVAIGGRQAFAWMRDFSRRNDVGKISTELGVSKDAAAMFKAALDGGDFKAAQDILNRAGKSGMLADAGPGLQALLDAAIVEGGPAAKEVSRRAIEPRAAAIGRELSQTLNGLFGRPRGMREVKGGLQAASAAQRQQLYDTAYAQAIDFATPEGQFIQNAIALQVDPAILNNVNRELRVGAADPRQISQIRFSIDEATGRPVFQQPLTTQQVDLITRQLQEEAQRLNTQVDPFGVIKSGVGMKYDALAGRIRDMVRKQNPAYDAALIASKDTIDQRQAAQMGATFFRPQTTREQVEQALAVATPEQRNAMKAGVRSQIDEIMMNARTYVGQPDHDIAELKKIWDTMSSAAARSKLTTLLGKQDADRLFTTLEEARVVMELRSAITRGSQTAQRQAIREQGRQIMSGGFLDILGEGRPAAATQRIVQMMTGSTPEAKALRMMGVYDEIANTLVQVRGKQAQDALKIIEKAIAGEKITTQQAMIVSAALTRAGAIGAYTERSEPLRYNPETDDFD